MLYCAYVAQVCVLSSGTRRDRKEGGGPGMNPFYKNLALWMVIGLVVVLLFNVFGGLSEKTTFEPNYSDFLRNVDAGSSSPSRSGATS